VCQIVLLGCSRATCARARWTSHGEKGLEGIMMGGDG
jgi:hypothetical protein